jgi:hypothetical protein
MRTITTTLVREWFSEILAEDKRIAYREIKPWGRVKKRPRRVDLTRFSGHITVTQRGVQNVEERQ